MATNLKSRYLSFLTTLCFLTAQFSAFGWVDPSTQPPQSYLSETSLEGSQVGPASEDLVPRDPLSSMFLDSPLSQPLAAGIASEPVMTINSGATATNTRQVLLTTTPPAGAVFTQMRFAFNSLNDSDFSAWESYSSSKTLQLPAYEGTNYINAQFKDASNNRWYSWTSIILDTVSPQGALGILEGSAVNTRQVTLNVNVGDGGSGLADMSYAFNSLNDGDFSSWQTYSPQLSIQLPNYEGTNYVNVRVRDKAGNVSFLWTSVLLDRNGPEAQLTAGTGSGATATQNVALTIQATDASGITAMRYAVNSLAESDFTAWQPFSSSSQVTIPPYRGTNYINVWLRDAAGNETFSWTPIVFDPVPPSGSILINHGNTKTSTRQVRLLLDAFDSASPDLQMSYAINSLNDGDFSVWEPFQNQKMVELPAYQGTNYVNVRVRDAAGNITLLWKPIVYDSSYFAVTDFLVGENMKYFDPALGTVESIHQYPVEGLSFKEYTQPTNFGIYAELLASIATGELNQGPISQSEALTRLDTLMTHLLEDQATLGYKGLLPWFRYNQGDWERRVNDIYGKQVAFEDNSNLTTALAIAYGALLHSTLKNNSTVYGTQENPGVLAKIDSFIANQRQGYQCMYDAAGGHFRRTMIINDAITTCGENGSAAPQFGGGNVDFFGAESRSPLLFLTLVYGNDFPGEMYQNLILSDRFYTKQNGEEVRVFSPFEGAFQMLWPSLLMPESENDGLKMMQERYVDVLLDYSQRNHLPGFLSASYDVKPAGNLLTGSDSMFTFGEGTGSWTAQGWRVVGASPSWIGTAFVQHNMDLEGRSLIFRYSALTDITRAEFEIKREINGELVVIKRIPVAMKNTSGAEEELRFLLNDPSIDWSDIDEIVLVAYGDGDPMNFTIRSFDADAQVYRSFYNTDIGIPEIAYNTNCCDTNVATLYTLGIAHMFRPAETEQFLSSILAEHPEVLSSHGLWEGINVTYDQTIREQIFANTATFVLGMTGTSPQQMMRYLRYKGLDDDLRARWNPRNDVNVQQSSQGIVFDFNGQTGVAFQLFQSKNVSGHSVQITYQSSVPIQGLKVEFKHQEQNVPVYSATLDLPATTGQPRTVSIDLPEDIMLWNIHELTLLFPVGYSIDEFLLSLLRIYKP